MEEEKCEELVEVPPAVLLLWPFARLPLLESLKALLESRNALSSENCMDIRRQVSPATLTRPCGEQTTGSVQQPSCLGHQTCG